MRLIDADKLEDVLAKHQTHYYGDSDYYEGISQGFNLAIYDVKETPTIDAEPVRHGKWIEHHEPYTWMGYTYWSCSECGFECGYEKDITIRTNYCPNCGYKMDLEEVKNEIN